MSRAKSMDIVALIGMAILTSTLVMRAPSESEVCEHVQQLLLSGAATGDIPATDEARNNLDWSSNEESDFRQSQQQCVDGLEKRRATLGYLEYRNQARCIVGAAKLTQLDACVGQEM